MAFKFGGKEMYLIFVFARCCWSIHSRVLRLGKQRKATPTSLHTTSNNLCCDFLLTTCVIIKYFYSSLQKCLLLRLFHQIIDLGTLRQRNPERRLRRYWSKPISLIIMFPGFGKVLCPTEIAY